MYDFKDKYNIEIISYCIMNNHAHMLLRTDSIKNLSAYIFFKKMMQMRRVPKRLNKKIEIDYFF